MNLEKPNTLDPNETVPSYREATPPETSNQIPESLVHWAKLRVSFGPRTKPELSLILGEAEFVLPLTQ